MGEIRVVKTDQEKRVVFGWANVAVKDGKEIIDYQEDIIDIYDLEDAVYNYVLDYRIAGENHKRTGVGILIESLVFTPEKIQSMNLEEQVPLGWWIGFKIEDPEVWNKIKNDEYLMFSIEGRGTREQVEMKPEIKKERLKLRE